MRLVTCLNRSEVVVLLSSPMGAYLENDFPRIGFYRRLRNGRRMAVWEFAEEHGGVKFDLGASRRAAYVSKSEGVIFKSW